MTVSDETIKSLDQVKKGKPRNFALVTKGVKIVGLLVKKKPIKASETKDLKKTAKGQKIFLGVVEGQGQDISFKMKADEFDSPPGKELMLKDFLISQAGFKCKPSYELVETLEEVNDDSEVDDSVVEGETGSDPEFDSIKSDWEKCKKLLPLFVQKFENRRTEILKPAKSVTEFLEGEAISLDDATTALGTVKKLLAELAAPSSPSGSSSTTPPVESGSGPDSPGDPLEVECRELKDLVYPKVKESLAAAPENKDEFVRLLEAASKDEKAGAFTDAISKYRILQGRLEQVGSATTENLPLSPDFAKGWETAKTEFRSANDTIDRQLDSLRTKLRSSDDEDFQRIAEMGLNAVTDGFRVPMQASLIQVDEATKSGVSGDAITKAISEAREAVADFHDHLETDERVEACDENPFEEEGVKVTIRKTLGGALTKLEQVLAGAFVK